MIASRQEIRILEWQPCEKNTLQGFLTVELPSGMIVHRLALHEKNGSRWVLPPAREWIAPDGSKRFAVLIEFRDEAVRLRFCKLVLEAFDEHRKQ